MDIIRISFELCLEAGEPRSAGLHLTDITADIALKLGILDSRYADRDVTRLESIGAVACGVAWEEWVIRQHPEVLHHPGEVIVDGIPMTPDGYSWSLDGDLTLHEFKLTRKSMAGDECLDGDQKYWLWMAQLKGYCRGAETLQARLHVFWVNGDYKDSGWSQYRVYDIRFTNREIKENWQMIVNHAKKMRARR